MTTKALNARPVARVSRKLPASNCRAETLLREWAKLMRFEPDLSPDHPKRVAARTRINAIQHDEISQVVARSDVGAAFQLLVAATAWPWRPADPNDPQSEVPDDLMDNITDGSDYKTRLILGAYIQIARQIGDGDLRDAEMWLTAEHIDGGGVTQVLRDSQSTVTFRELV